MDIAALGVYSCLFIGLYFEVFLLISFLQNKPAKKTSDLPRYYPTVTILVPCWNKAKTLSATIHSLLELQYPKKKLAIAIIDDGSTDGTFEAAQEFANHPQVKIFTKKNEGSKYAALNFGLEHTTGELVGCLDADSFVAKDALLEVVKKFESDPDIMAVTPAMRVERPRNPLELMQAVEYLFGVFYRKMFDNLKAITVLPGPFSIYRREVFAKIGGFRHAHHTEDMEMAFRMHKNGLLIANAHTALVSTKVPSNLGGLVRQRIRWSRGFLENARDYSFMFFNPRYGNIGILALPFGVLAFGMGLFTAAYMLYTTVSSLIVRGFNLWTTGVPLQLPTPSFEWFFMDTSMLTFLVFTVIGLVIYTTFLGSRIAETKLPLHSLLLYTVGFGFIAPIWLARAVWDSVLARETGWLT